MTRRDLNDEWARSQVEAWADGSLTGESRDRMAAALAADGKLRAAVERAAAVRRALRRATPEPLPAGLRRRLLAIPSESLRPSFVLPVAAGAAVAIAAAVIWLRPAPPQVVVEDQRVVAVQEFEVAMRYLQKSARITQGEVSTAVGASVRDALAASREALARETEKTGG